MRIWTKKHSKVPPSWMFYVQVGCWNFFVHHLCEPNVRLLEFMINYWDHDLGMFDLQGESLEIASEDIYFIADLSWWGASVNLEGTSRGSDPLSVHNYIDIYYALGTQKRGSCIPIVHIRNFPLQVLASTIVRVAGSSSLHLATQNQMRLAIDCMQGALYDWCLGVILIMRKQLSNYKRAGGNVFGIPAY